MSKWAKKRNVSHFWENSLNERKFLYCIYRLVIIAECEWRWNILSRVPNEMSQKHIHIRRISSENGMHRTLNTIYSEIRISKIRLAHISHEQSFIALDRYVFTLDGRKSFERNIWLRFWMKLLFYLTHSKG